MHLWTRWHYFYGGTRFLRTIIIVKTRLTLASILGPFGVHLLKFTLPTPVHWCTIWDYWNFRLEFVTHTSQHTWDLPYLSYDCVFWIHLVFLLLLVLFRIVGLLVEAKDDWTFSYCFHRIFFCSRVYMYVHGMRYLHHEVHELDGYNHEFWKTTGYSLKCVLELVASTSHAKVHSKAPHSTGLSRTSSKT